MQAFEAILRSLLLLWGGVVDLGLLFALPVLFGSCSGAASVLVKFPEGGCPGSQSWRLFGWFCGVLGVLRISAAIFPRERSLWYVCVGSMVVEAALTVAESGSDTVNATIAICLLCAITSVMMVAYDYDFLRHQSTRRPTRKVVVAGEFGAVPTSDQESDGVASATHGPGGSPATPVRRSDSGGGCCARPPPTGDVYLEREEDVEAGGNLFGDEGAGLMSSVEHRALVVEAEAKAEQLRAEAAEARREFAAAMGEEALAAHYDDEDSLFMSSSKDAHMQSISFSTLRTESAIRSPWRQSGLDNTAAEQTDTADGAVGDGEAKERVSLATAKIAEGIDSTNAAEPEPEPEQ